MSEANGQDQAMDFDDLAPREVPVRIGGKQYVLREASEDAAVKWRNSLLKATKLGPNGKPASIDGLADSEPYLVSLCLYNADKEGRLPLLPSGDPDNRQLVSLTKVRSWSPKIVKPLYERLKLISGMADEEVPAKDGDSAAVEDGADDESGGDALQPQSSPSGDPQGN